MVDVNTAELPQIVLLAVPIITEGTNTLVTEKVIELLDTLNGLAQPALLVKTHDTTSEFTKLEMV